MNSFIETLKQLGPTRLAIMGGILFSLLVMFVFLSMRVSAPDYSLLYNDLSSADSSAIAASLEEAQIRYQISEDASRVTVPEEDVGRARMLLAEAGLPNGGSLGYELFDQTSGFGTTNDIVNLNKVRALEGELARTVASLDPVRSARVHLVLPERELFSRESRPASASVALGLRPGRTMTQNQIQAVQALVASAVPDLSAQKVSLIDQAGNLLARGDEEETDLVNVKADEMRLKYEQRTARAIEDLVGRIVGYNNVRATVTADLNFDRVSTNEELYDPESQIARSVQSIEENNTEREPNEENVSVENNLPGVGNDLFLGDNPTSESNRVEETTNFEISRTTRNVIREGGDVNRLSVAVLVDGTYTTGAEGEQVYAPRSEEELDKIAALVQSAVGYNVDRGDTLEVVNMQFADINVSDPLFENTLFGFDKNELLDAAKVLTIAILVILTILLVVQPMIGRVLAVEGVTGKGKDDEDTDLLPGAEARAALAAPDGMTGSDGTQLAENESGNNFLGDADDGVMIDVESVQGQVRASSLKKVEDIVGAYPEESLMVLRSWINEG